ncbi:hypothetical protein TraAM80_06365 [Trypanosoma rangeli]|uniref:Uncharacterized protein n=1 Tax=Trypanosoma rangeli TaxID=5698 RepID=A0A422NAE8_TRYRA|nr:uncharacterized protein TraAM80_06365 [Trypanosoma rangeli]RNF02459.1 hypothetical protein TraAM80_06365 [Trypanosoma rangeli]|eukprot:RNF02459.1 hypothetical protein TraAM80_06365 [Trypanosoma rangeli]
MASTISPMGVGHGGGSGSGSGSNSISARYRRLANERDGNDSATPLGLHSSGVTQNREVEPRFARIVAEYEYKLLEERGRAQERETQLLEELQWEKAQVGRLMNERAQLEGEDRQENHAGRLVSMDEYERVQEQLKDTRLMLQEAERRYQQEKRELLNLRTSQLLSETSKRGQEGDIIARAMQVMSEYEAVVRSSEENSLARLSHHMETFEKEWICRSRAFEEQKVAFEGAMMEKTRQALAEHEHDVEEISRTLLEKTTQALRNHSEVRLELEGEVMRHADMFKEEYKEILDKEFYDRCRMYDEKIAERERGWVKTLQEERQKIIAAEQLAVKEHETLHVHALEEAMRDLSQLREQLVREHQEQQTDAMNDLIARRDDLQRDHEQQIARINEKTREMQRECAAAVEEMQNTMKELHVQMAVKEAEMVRRLQEAEQRAAKAALAKGQELRNEVEQLWSSMLEKESVAYKNDVERLSKEYQATINRMRSEQAEREGALLASYEQRVVQVEESADLRWSGRVEEAMRGLERHMEVVQMLRHDNEGMSARIERLTQEVQLSAAEMEGAVARARREQDIVWHQKVEEMRQRYDRLLDEALGGTDDAGVGPGISRHEYEKVLSRLKEWEEKCVALRRQCELQRTQEQEELNAQWGKRLDEERAQRAAWETEQLSRFTKTREAFLHDMEEKEKAAVERLQAERDALHKAFLQQQQGERERCDAAIAQAQIEENERCVAFFNEQEGAFQERIRVLEARVAQSMADVRSREGELQEAFARKMDEAQQSAMDYIRQEREALQTAYDKKFAELHAEQQRWEVQRTKLHEEIAEQYAERFVKAKANMQRHLVAVTELMLSYQEQCEARWLQARKEELEVFINERVAYKKRLESSSTADLARVQAQVEETLRMERAALDERNRALQETLRANQASMEQGAAEYAMKMFEEQQCILAEATWQRSQEQQQQWESLKTAWMEKTWSMEGAYRAEIQQMRLAHETELEEERRLWRAEVERQQDELQIEKCQHVEQLRQREVELRNKHESALKAERQCHEGIVVELRKEQESRLAEERQRAQVVLREREAAFDLELRRLLERMETQDREQQESANERVRVMQDEFDRVMRAVKATSQQYQEDYMRRVEQLEQLHLTQLEEQKDELQKKYEESLCAMHTGMEMRLREYLTSDMDVVWRVEEQRAVLREEMEAKYVAFMQEQLERVKAEREERDGKVHDTERLHNSHLAALRHEMDTALLTYFEKTESRAREAAEQARMEFEKNLQASFAMLEDEQRRRAELENQLREAHAQVDALHLSYEEQKLQALREVQAKYENVYKEMHDALRAEREAWARRALGEEEQRLLKELTAREERRRQSVDAFSPYSAASPAVGRHALSQDATPVALPQQQLPPPQHYQRGGDESSQLNVHAVPLTPYGRTAGNGHTDVLYDVNYEKLQQLWSVMEVPEAEQEQALCRWSQLPLPQRALEVKKETRRLELQLPLLEVVTRREFLMHRLKELERSSSSNNNSKSSGGNSVQMEEFRKELLRLTEHLKSEIPRHESMYGSTFRFRGSRYMDTLLDW